MALVIEDGSNVPNANSYATVEELVAYAAERGIAIPAEAPALEILLIKAMDYIEFYAGRYRGYATYDDQALSWPRTYDGADQGVPDLLKKVQIIVAIAAQTIELFPNTAGTARTATRQTVGPITVQYQQTSGRAAKPSIPQADSLLRELFASSMANLRVVRA